MHNPVLRQQLMEALQRRYASLWVDVQREMAASESFAEISGGAGDDAAVADVAVDLRHADIHRDVVEMRDISEAMSRVGSDPDFACCIDCGELIPEARLLAQPTARRCLGCQSKAEARSARAAVASL